MEYKKNGKVIKINFNFNNISVKEFLEKVGENRESVIVKINGKLVTEFDILNKNDNVELIRIGSGG